MSPYSMRVPRKCNAKCYQNRLVPVLNKNIAVQLTKFDYRLSNKLDSNLQKLRCRANYHALKFNDLINEMGKTLVDIMRMKSKHFIALHLRLVAFNLGYLPGGDKPIITELETTLKALEVAKSIVVPGGLISLVVYVGHPGGWEELKTIRDFISKLSVEKWICYEFQTVDRSWSPILIFLFKNC